MIDFIRMKMPTMWLMVYFNHSDHTKRLNQNEYAHHVIDCVVDGLNNLLLPVSVTIAGSSRTVVHVIHIDSPEIFDAIQYFNFTSQKLLG